MVGTRFVRADHFFAIGAALDALSWLHHFYIAITFICVRRSLLLTLKKLAVLGRSSRCRCFVIRLQGLRVKRYRC